MIDTVSSYAEQSRVTDPGRMSDLLAGLPQDVAALRRAARGLVIHYRVDDPASHGIPPERMTEIDSRHAETMLARLVELSDAPLSADRAAAERLVGCCRDFTVLFLAMARSVGITARARVGFASYFVPGFRVDHEVAEVWDQEENRWRLVDAELGDVHVDPNDSARVDPLDVSRDRFLVAGDAWRRCRAGDADPETFVVDPHVPIPELRSWPYLCHNVVQDLAALLKREMILWDSWGIAEKPQLDDEDLRLLDQVASLTTTPEIDPAALQALCDQSPGLAVPDVVTSYDPLGGPPRTVATS